jgi:hypothetical protein
MNTIFADLLGIGTLALALAIFLVLSLACEAGFQFGQRRGKRATPDDHDHAVTATLTSGMLALLAFILGLTVNYAQGRFETRRDLVVTEANAIGTAWLRARLVGGPDGEAIAADIRQFAQTRLEFTQAGRDGPVEALNERTSQESADIWSHATAAARASPTPIMATLLNALNEMIDDAQSQRFAFLGEAPGAMLDFMMLGSILAIGAMGYEMGLRRGRQLVLSSLLLLMWTGAMVMTVDLNRPRAGIARTDARPLEWTIHDIDDWSKAPASAPSPAAP